MKLVQLRILCVALISLLCIGAVSRYHHHTDGGRFCMCMQAANHGHSHDHHGDCGGACNHGQDPAGCQRAALSIDSELCHRQHFVPAPDAVGMTGRTDPCCCELCACTWSWTVADGVTVRPPGKGFAGIISRRGPPELVYI